ncbi:MAG: UDP-N-acetylglucosamine--N-acetylmuramyl-(pentapeptide) pyrophosphoryl-undecaprenol N-acetylglucosamine transferase [Actinobacteria bacterium]|uniref:Unannotated protein n=1 Tax=freshwater metagenome TaxID=449393 RepID=A0A6J6HSV9_9ZZZZ|nr:UDP-N-acetylglucosamine--N-acetylmuramyl-(pentapeptide) pyrophosphoryl-undecaprenol N-acetylglucosamine transferase [Actinomycetota bacterium]
MTNFLLAGGGTAGHVNPLLALADVISEQSTSNKVWALGTAEGLEQDLVPARGYELLEVARLPFPRKINLYAIRFPFAFRAAIEACKVMLTEKKIDVVVGFGGYASAPAYLAAKSLRIPVVVHEANALPGWANKLGSRFASAVGVAFANTNLKNSKHVGMPLRKEIENLDLSAKKDAARAHFGLDKDTLTLLVTGGSLGAKKINETIEQSRKVLSAAGIQVLHIVGSRSDLAEVKEKDFVRIGYCDRMDLAIQASDFAVSRAGASTVSEFAAVGLPALYVPYPVGNGEQKFNVVELLGTGGAITVLDADFTPSFVSETLVPVLSNSKKLKAMAKAAKSVGISDGANRLFSLVQGVL